jgi:hypothetical protein
MQQLRIFIPETDHPAKRSTGSTVGYNTPSHWQNNIILITFHLLLQAIYAL